MSSYRYGRPALKSNVDVQLQTAFSDGNWSTVIRLAAKRAATLKDPYYEAVKICAESQLDGTAEKCAVLVAVDDLVKTKKTADIDTLELYEWACRDFFAFDVEYADTLGPLRARWAKANPGSPLALQCLQACLDKWDLVSAQQVCLILSLSSFHLLSSAPTTNPGRSRPVWTRPTPTRPTAGTCSGTSSSPSSSQCVLRRLPHGSG
jgi:hypothetical protein